MSVRDTRRHFWFFFSFLVTFMKKTNFANSYVATSCIWEVGVSFPFPAGSPCWFSSTASTERLLGANNIRLPSKDISDRESE